MEGIGQGLGAMMLMACIFCLMVGGCIVGVGGYLTTSNDIRSTVKIEPRYELVVDDSNNVDTVWVYERD